MFESVRLKRVRVYVIVCEIGRSRMACEGAGCVSASLFPVVLFDPVERLGDEDPLRQGVVKVEIPGRHDSPIYRIYHRDL